MKITDLIDPTILAADIADGFVAVTPHPTLPLFIHNYTQRAQWENHWTDATMNCRGLVCHADGNIIARPFKKFFNYDQLTDIPAEPFEVFEKLDGSLGIVFWYGDKWHIATRGSFTSDQAIKAESMMQHISASGRGDLTLCFEIIYPENRIVVDYGGNESLVLLAAIHNESGDEVAYDELDQWYDGPIAKRYPFTSIDQIKAINTPNSEGFVIRWQSGLRCKIKMAEYVRLHKLVTGLNVKAVWEHLKAGIPLEVMLDNVPDEFMAWVRSVAAELQSKYTGIAVAAKNAYKDFPTRREFAEYHTKGPFPDLMFAMLDKKPYADMIWKRIKPAGNTVFKNVTEAVA